MNLPSGLIEKESPLKIMRRFKSIGIDWQIERTNDDD